MPNLSSIPVIGNLQLSANNASYALTASYAATASMAQLAGYITSASFASVAEYALNTPDKTVTFISSDYTINLGDNLLVTSTASILLTLPTSSGGGSQFSLLTNQGTNVSVTGVFAPTNVSPLNGVQSTWTDVGGPVGWYWNQSAPNVSLF
jgi:hypothetical protein